VKDVVRRGYDADTNRPWRSGAGFTVEHEEFVPEGGGAVLFRATVV
jgi:hypothetical protein